MAVILDACRFDTFAKVNFLPGRTRAARFARLMHRGLDPPPISKAWPAASTT